MHRANSGLPMYVPLVEEFISLFAPSTSQKDTRVFVCGRHIPNKCKLSSVSEIMNSDLGEKTAEDPLSSGFKASFASPDPSSPTWVDVQSYSRDDLDLLEKKFGLHPLTTEDIFEDKHYEKIESFPNYTLVIVNEIYFHADTHELLSNCVKIVLSRDLLVTFHGSRAECVQDALYRAYHQGPQRDNPLTASDWPLYAILDNMANLLRAHVDHVEAEADILEELVLLGKSSTQADLLARIGRCRREVTAYSSHLVSKKSLLQKFIETKNHKAVPFIAPEHMAFFRDVLDEVLGLEERLSLTKEALNNLHATYLGRLSIEVAEASNAANAVMKKFSAVATIFIPLTWVAGLWGMNVRVPGDLADDNNYIWFSTLLICSLAWGLLATILLWRKGWL